MKIVKLNVENILRISAVEITPDGAVVVIGGANGAGKSSVLAAIEMALGGKAAAPEKPVHEGAETGRILLDLGDIIVERTFTAAGSTRLVVKASSGAVFPSPQALLDGLVGRLTFDPLDFARRPSKEQAAVLRDLVGLDTTAIDEERAKVYQARTEANREVAKNRAAAAAIPAAPEGVAVPEAEPDAVALVEQLEALRQRNAERVAAQNAAATAQDVADKWLASAQAQDQRVEALKAQLAVAKTELADRVHKCTHANDVAKRRNDVAIAALEAMEDDQPIKAAIADVRRMGAIYRAEEERRKLDAAAEALIAIAKARTADIERLDAEKKSKLDAAAFPIPGLAVDDSGVTLRGLPFAQGSSAEQLRASVAIGLALNPRLKVMLVRDGSLLDHNGMQLLAELAAEHDSQLWVERVGRADAAAFIIEDGKAAEVTNA